MPKRSEPSKSILDKLKENDTFGNKDKTFLDCNSYYYYEKDYNKIDDKIEK